MNGLVAANLTHHPGRTAASIIGVATGIILVVLTVGLVRGMLRERGKRDANIGAQIMLSQLGQQSISPTSLPVILPVRAMAEIRQVPGVAAVTAVAQHMELKGDGVMGIRQMEGIEFDSYASMSRIRLVEGEPLPASGDVAIVDVKYAAEHHTRVGDKLELFDRQFTIIGIYEPAVGSRIKIPLATLQEELGASGKCSVVFVKCQNPEEQEVVARRLLERFPDLRVLLVQDLPELFATGFGGFNVFLKIVAGLAAVISVLVILLTMYSAVAERTRQIGILKSLGASKLFIAAVIEKEALTISVLGVLGGLIVAQLARIVLIKVMGLTIELELDYIFYSSVAGLASGLLGAIYPAWRAASLDPVDALRYE